MEEKTRKEVLEEGFARVGRATWSDSINEYFRMLGELQNKKMKTYEVEAIFRYEVDACSESEAIELAEEIHGSNCTNLGDAPEITVNEVQH